MRVGWIFHPISTQIFKSTRLLERLKSNLTTLYLSFLMEFQYQCGILTLFLTFPFTESQTIEDFGETLHLDRSDLEHLRSVFLAVENGDIGKFFVY